MSLRPTIAPLTTFALACVALAAPVAAQPGDAIEVIEIVGTTPLGAELDTDAIAANVQTASADELREQGALDLADFLRRSMGSVFVNEVQSNPLQPDVQYRGFVGSPLLGLAQGLAVYQDGTRLNEPFGDTVNWALLPESAIAEIYLLPGANPLFGLNALGGAIAVRTKSGFAHPGTHVEALAGSFGRSSVQAETGGTFERGAGYFVTASLFEEDGWRDYSPSEAQQLFGKLSFEGERSRLDVSLTQADTDLIGNGPAPIDLIELDPKFVFTRPDRTENALTMLNVSAEQTIKEAITLRGSVYLRRSDVRTLNGDDSDFMECVGTPGFVCEAADAGGEELVLDENDAPIPFAPTLEGAALNRTRTDQDSRGFGLQADFRGERAGRANLFTIGVARDSSDVTFEAHTELGALDATRLAVGGGSFVGEAFTDLVATVDNTGVFFSDTLSLGPIAALTLSGRYNRTHVVLEDQLGLELNGDHVFERFNPALGLTAGSDKATFYFGYGEANRAPSPVELTCADEDDPCRLPNAFLADPPLEQVVAKTLEAGVRGGNATRWHAGVFRTTNEDDILFVSAGTLTNQGFFDNVGKTRREGVELNFAGSAGEKISWSLDYTQLDATFRERFAVSSPNNPAAVGGEIAVEPGDRLPLIPERLLKAGARFAPSARLTFGLDVIAASGAHFRGDEGNLLDEVDGYTLLSARVEYRLGEHASVFVNVDNLLDEDYATFGLFGEADEVLGPAFDDPRFLGPGAPRAAWAGVRLQF